MTENRLGNAINRRQFVAGVFAAGLSGALQAESTPAVEDDISRWHAETELVSPRIFGCYNRDGKTRGFASLEKLEAAFEKVMREVKDTKVDDIPAVWSLYNMGYVVKTKESLFSIDLVHRRCMEFAPMLDFALVTHIHGDHYRGDLCRAVAGRKKLVISNFLPVKGYTRAKKTFKIKDVEIRTSLIDHNRELVDFTTAFEIKVGNWTLYHTGDSGRGTEPKLETIWGRPDLWLFFPGCGIDTAKAVEKVNAKRIVFGHLWELGHGQNHTGRLDEPLIRRALVKAAKGGSKNTSLAYWGDRIV